jgi:AmiR/NasT family two-component response regulator
MNPAKVLVEEELIVSRDIQNRLGRLGYEVLGATARARKAVRLTAELHPDLILMDIRLAGDMDESPPPRRSAIASSVPSSS